MSANPTDLRASGPDPSGEGLFLGLGELLWDEFPDGRRPGGAPANVAFHAAQLGLPAAVLSRVGTDPAGDEIVRYLAAQGLSVQGIQRDPRRPTGRVTVELQSDGQPRFRIHENVAWDAFQATDDCLALVRRAAAVCFGTLGQRSEPARAAIQTCLAQVPSSALRVFDVNLRQRWFDRETIVDSLARADLVKLNDAEVDVLGPLLGFGAVRSADFARRLAAAWPVRWVCITRGADGCELHAGIESVDVPGEPVAVCDTVGAGDAFTAALTVSLLAGWPLDRAARFANRVGGLVASRPGAMPMLRDEYARLRESFVAPNET